MTSHSGCLLWRQADIFGAKVGGESALVNFDLERLVQLDVFFRLHLHVVTSIFEFEV